MKARLQALGSAQLREMLEIPAGGSLPAACVSFTTTDINAALSVTGTVLKEGSERTAVLALVATETEREASWSRLEGLVFHWGE